MSTKPLTPSASSDSQNERESPNTTMLAPNVATATSSVRPARRPSGRRVSIAAPKSAPTAGALRSTPRPVGPTCRIERANNGSRATAPPNSTASRSSMIAPNRIWVWRTKRSAGEHAKATTRPCGRAARASAARACAASRHAQGRQQAHARRQQVDERRGQWVEQPAQRRADHLPPCVATARSVIALGRSSLGDERRRHRTSRGRADRSPSRLQREREERPQSSPPAALTPRAHGHGHAPEQPGGKSSRRGTRSASCPKAAPTRTSG